VCVCGGVCVSKVNTTTWSVETIYTEDYLFIENIVIFLLLVWLELNMKLAKYSVQYNIHTLSVHK